MQGTWKCLILSLKMFFKTACHGWNRLLPTPIFMLKSQPLVPQNVAVFGEKVFKEVIELN